MLKHHKMKQLLSLIIWGFFPIVLTAQHETNFEHYHGNGSYENATLNPISVFRNSKLYSKADTNSSHNILPPASTIYIKEVGQSQGQKWYHIEAYSYIEKNYSNSKGYIRFEDVIPFNIMDDKGNRYYIWKSIENHTWSDTTFVVKVSHPDSSKTDTLILTNTPYFVNVSENYTNSALKKLKGMITLEFYNAQCPGTFVHVFVGNCGDSLSVIESSFSSGEGTWYDSKVVYLPFRFENGNVLLVANGDVKNIFNYQTGGLNIFPYPADCGIPIEDLVVIESESAEEEMTEENGEENGEVSSEEGEYTEKTETESEDANIPPKLKITHHSIEFFRWNGHKLVKVK